MIANGLALSILLPQSIHLIYFICSFYADCLKSNSFIFAKFLKEFFFKFYALEFDLFFSQYICFINHLDGGRNQFPLNEHTVSIFFINYFLDHWLDQ
jgi:hypothetical protein